MIKNIIFDLGNVLLSFAPQQVILDLTNDLKKSKQFFEKIIQNNTWLSLDKGLILLDEARSIYLSQYPEQQANINYFFEHWMEYLTAIETNVEILKKANQSGYNTYALSNFMEEAYSYVKERYNFFSLFNGQIISGKEKVIKPELEIYNILLTRYNLDPKESVYIDDILPFLKPAKKLGFSTIWLKPNTDLEQELKKFNVYL